MKNMAYWKAKNGNSPLKQAKDKGERKLLEKRFRNALTREPTVVERIENIEEDINKWKMEERQEKLAEQEDIIPLDTSMGQKYDDEGRLIEIKAADGGYIKKYAHGGGVRKAKFVDSYNV